MIFYHFKDLTDYFQYLKPSGWTYFDLDVQEVTTPDSLDYYVILTAYNAEKERGYVCVQQIGSHQKYAGRVESAAGRLGSKNDAASQKLIEAQKKADEKSKEQQKEQLIKEFKAAAKRIYKEVEFSESERRWSTEPLAYLPKSVEQVEAVGQAEPVAEPESEEPKPAAGKPEKKPKPQSKPAAENDATEAQASSDAEGEETEGASKSRARGVRSAPPKNRLISKRK